MKSSKASARNKFQISILSAWKRYKRLKRDTNTVIIQDKKTHVYHFPCDPPALSPDSLAQHLAPVKTANNSD